MPTHNPLHTIILLLLPILTITQYIAATITPTSYIISQYCSYNIVLQRNNNPISNDFIFPVSSVPTTAYIELDMPSAYTVISNSTNPTCFITTTSVPLSCVINTANNTITIKNVFTTTAMQTAETIAITINNIKNPSRAESSGNFQYYIKTSTGTIIDQSPSATSGLYDTSITFLPASFTSCSVSANSNYISTRSRLTFTITTNNAIPGNGQFIIDIPLTWSGDLDQSNTIVSTPTCTPVSGLSTVTCSYSILSSPVNIARVTIVLSSAGVAAGTQFIVDVSSILTPPYTNYPITISLYSQWSDGIKIDTCTSTIANTIPIPFRSVGFNVQSGTTVVQSTFTAKMDLTLAKPFSSTDQIALFLPNNFLTNNQISISSTNYAIFSTTVQSSTSNPTTTKVILSNFPAAPSVLPANNIFTLFFTSITNYISTQPQTITIIFYRSSQSYQSSSTIYTSTIGTLTSFTIASDSVAVNYVGDSLFTIGSQFTVPIDSYIQVVYNSDINAADLGSTAISFAALNGVRVSSVSYAVQLNTITITNMFQRLFTNGTIQIRIPQLTNPPTLKPTPYTLTIKTSSNYAIASSVYTYTAALQAFKSGSATLTASSYQVMATGVAYTLSFQTFYGFKSLSILIPPEVSTNVGFETTCTPNTFTSCAITNADITGYKNLTFIGTTTAGIQTISWGSNINPNSFKPTSSFQLFTYSGGWGVQKSTGYIILTMNQQANILSAVVIPSSYKNNQLISVEIDYTLPARSPNGTITLTMPDVIDISGASCSGVDVCTIIPPKITIGFTNLNFSITHPYALILNNVRNAPSFKPVGNINMTLVSSDNYASLTTTMATWTNIQVSSFTTAVSSDVGYRGQNGLFTFNIAGLSGKQTYVNIKININFGALTTAPLSSTLVSAYQVRYSIIGQGTSQQSFILQTPIYIGDYTFTLKTYTSDQYSMGESTSNVWRHSCYGTQCRACTGTTCTNCYNSSLSNFYIFNTADSSCIRACSVGFYLDSSNNNCIPCSTNCLECVNSSATCTKCPIYTNTTPSTVYYLNTIFNTCVLQCSTTYYPNTITQRCSPCIQPCYTCSNDNVCKTCVNGYYFLATSSNCLLSCPINVMVPNNVNKTCDFCSANCLTCSIFAYNCTSCNNTNSLYLQGNVCVPSCSSQKFLKNNICTQCESPCRICFNSTTTCSQCFPNSTLPLWYDFKCISISECAIGHYVNSVNGSCDSCPSQCQACISLTNCSACSAGFYLYANTCIDTCPNITYKNNGTLVCDPCVGCLTCTSATVCTSCRSIQFFYLSTCKSICPSGTYASTEVTTGNISRAICAECPADCPTCQNSSYCLSCLASQYFYRGTCNIICPISTFPNSPNCTNCPATCSTCSSLTNCLTCITNYSLQNSACVLTCSKGISHNQVCYPCGLNCALCQNTTCIRCDPFYYLLNNVCMSQCSANTLTLDNMTCVPCTNKYVNCTTCNQTHCLSCSEGELTLGQCLPCVPGFYTLNSKCVLCPSSCTICTSPTQCSSCKSNYYIEANFCVSTCPKNKVPNGTKCDVCTNNCAICNLVTSGCSVCVGGMFQFEGLCVSTCPDPYVVNLNKTLCVTKQQFSQQYSKASKPIYFPFSIAFLIIIGIAIGLKCYVKTMHLATFLVSIVAWIQLACWVSFGVVQYLFYVNQQDNALKGIILVLAGIVTLIITNLIFLRFYFKYFVGDAEFEKWYRKHSCANNVLVVLGAVFNFKAHRIIYSKVMDRDQFSLVLSSAKKIVPISILSIVSILVSSGPIIVGACFAVYYSLNQDQQFFNALDTLTATGIMILLMLLDLRHSPNYFIDEHETQNLRNKMYYEDFQSFSINNAKSEKFKEDFEKGSNQSRQNLVEGADTSNMLDNLTTAKKIRVKKNNLKGGEFGETVRQTSNTKNNIFSGEESKNQLLKQQQEYKEQEIDDDEDEQPQIANKWVEKRFDHHGYLMKYDEKNNLIRYDKNGNRVEIDENGEHKKYDAEGYLLKQDPSTGRMTRYDADGFIVGKDNTRFDERGYQVQKNVDQNGLKSYKYYDENGYEVIKDPETNQQIKLDKKGNKVLIDPITKQHKSYNKQGYQIIYGKDDSKNKYKNENGQFVRYNEKTKKWQEYDPEDGYVLIKNQKGQYQKIDQHGFLIEKDQYGNIYRYDRDGNRIVINPNGSFRRFDKQGYEIKRDPITGQQHRFDDQGYEVKMNEETGEKTFYNSDGYRVERDFYGKATLYDEQGNLVILDPDTKKYRKFNKEGLEMVDDGNGGYYLKDKRGRKVVQFNDGYYEKYDEEGNKIWLDEEGYEVQTDEHGNTNRYDKIGDLVDEDDEQIDQSGNQKDGWQLDEGTGDNLVLQKPTKQRKTKFKIKKQYNHEEQYNKMVQQSKPHLIFDLQEEEPDEENLKQFHDVEPVKQYQLEKQYQTLYETEAQNQLIKRDLSQGNLKINLEQLAQNDYTPYTNLRQKINKNRNKSKSFLGKNDDDENESDLIMEPEETQSKHEIKSVADASVNQRSFENEGVKPITQRSHYEDEDLESVQEINAANMAKNKSAKSRRSAANFDKNSQVGGTRSENNYLQNSTKVKKEEEVRKIFDSDEQVQSLQEEQWQNEKADIFYKENNSNYKTNTHEKGGQIQDQEDILSDYIPQQPIDEHHHKASQQNLLQRRYMQSIEEVEDQLFQKLKSEDHRVKRTDFKLSGKPNPLVQYAKTIDAKKIQQQKNRPKDRYAENRNNFRKR